MEDNFDFVGRRWRAGMFQPNDGWKRLSIAPVSRWRRLRVAAAVVGVVTLTAVAALVWRQQQSTTPLPESQEVEQTVLAVEAVRAIDFDNAPLTEVVAKIEEVYGVEVANVPADAEAYRLTLHYEGNVADLVEAINDILGTKLELVGTRKPEAYDPIRQQSQAGGLRSH